MHVLQLSDVLVSPPQLMALSPTLLLLMEMVAILMALQWNMSVTVGLGSILDLLLDLVVEIRTAHLDSLMELPPTCDSVLLIISLKE